MTTVWRCVCAYECVCGCLPVKQKSKHGAWIDLYASKCLDRRGQINLLSRYLLRGSHFHPDTTGTLSGCTPQWTITACFQEAISALEWHPRVVNKMMELPREFVWDCGYASQACLRGDGAPQWVWGDTGRCLESGCGDGLLLLNGISFF